MKIGVFDTGVGGVIVGNKLQKLIPSADIVIVNDRDNVPYGNRSSSEIFELAKNAIQPLIKAGCKIIVIACNTVTMVAIDQLRAQHPEVLFVGIEPMIKPAAAHTKTGRITVLATKATLASERYANLKETWAKDIEVIEPDCSNWATLIESGHANKVPIESVVEKEIENGSDVIILGCTHYHWLNDRAEKAARGRATIMEPSNAIGKRVTSLIVDHSERTASEN